MPVLGTAAELSSGVKTWEASSGEEGPLWDSASWEAWVAALPETSPAGGGTDEEEKGNAETVGKGAGEGKSVG